MRPSASHTPSMATYPLLYAADEEEKKKKKGKKKKMMITSHIPFEQDAY